MVAKWVVELGQYEITFVPGAAIKGHALVDFFSESLETQLLPTPQEFEHWNLYFDGSLQLEDTEAGVLLMPPEGELLKYVLQMNFRASNNAAEYAALFHGLHIAASLGIR